MKNRVLLGLFAAVMLLSACGDKQDLGNNRIETEPPTATEAPAETALDAQTDAAVRAELSAMMESFISLDYESAVSHLTEDTRALLNWSDESQREFYDCLFKNNRYTILRTYGIGDAAFAQVRVTAPDMLEIYGEINLRYIDAMLNSEITNEEEARAFNQEQLRQLTSAPEVKLTDTEVIFTLTQEDDTWHVVAEQAWVNAMLGNVTEASKQVSEAIEEGLESQDQEGQMEELLRDAED